MSVTEKRQSVTGRYRLADVQAAMASYLSFLARYHEVRQLIGREIRHYATSYTVYSSTFTLQSGAWRISMSGPCRCCGANLQKCSTTPVSLAHTAVKGAG